MRCSGACDDAAFVSEEHGIDLEAEVAVVTDDVPLGTTAQACRRACEAHRARQ